MAPVPVTVPGVLGARNRHLSLEGASVQVVDYPPDLQLPAHEHDHATLCYVYTGSVRDNSERHSDDFGPQTLVLRPPHQAHATQFASTGAHSLVVEMRLDRLAGVPGRMRENLRPLTVRNETTAWLARQLHGELTRPDTLSRLAVEGLLLALLAEAERPGNRTTPAPASLRVCEEYLHDNFLQPVGLVEVAAAAKLHPSRVARAFRTVHGCTVGEYVRRLRLLWAAEQLLQPGQTVSEIALAAGFYDQSHFTTSFRKVVGQTPAAYRSAHGGAKLPE